MSNIEIPTYQDLMYPTLVAIDALGGSAAIAELEEEVPKLASVTDEQLAVEYPAGSASEGVSKVINRLHWARTYLKKIGALDNSTRGIWSLTALGRSLLGLDPVAADSRLKTEDNRVRSEMRKSKQDESKARQVQDLDGDDVLADWRDEMLTEMKDMEPAAFERLAVRLLREAGFRNVEVLGKSGDGGIDGVEYETKRKALADQL